MTLPPSAVRLMQEIAKYTGVQGDAARVVELPASSGAADVQTLQRELANSARQLSSILDEGWKQYLALPAEVSGPDRLPSADALKRALDRFQRVVKDPQYQAPAQKPEFQQTHALLQQLYAHQSSSSPLALPPPPPDRN